MHVFEREAQAGGLLRYGIPDFKMEKHHIDRRVKQMEAEGVVFHYGVNVGVDKTFASLHNEFDAVLFAGGAEDPRDPELPGQDLAGVHSPCPSSRSRTGAWAARRSAETSRSSPRGKHVVVIGGGDTASDCIGTAFRQGALSVTQLDIRPKPPEREDKLAVWPYWPTKMRTSSSQAEGAEREFQAATLGIEGKNGPRHRRELRPRRREAPADRRHRVRAPGRPRLPRHRLCRFRQDGAPRCSRGVAIDRRGNVVADDRDYRTSSDKVFAAGDMRRGQSLVVWAIREGRQAARAIDEFLMGESVLPR